MSSGALHKLRWRSRYQKRTEQVFCTRSKRRVRKSILTFRTQDLVYFIFEGFRSTLQQVWHFVTFCDVSKCHDVTLLDFVTFLSFCCTVRIFWTFIANPKMSQKRRQVTNVTNPHVVLLRQSANINVSKLRFARTNPESWYWLSLRSRFGITLGTTLNQTK